jgi:DNA-binding IclR family transcriptional regulator
MSDITQLPVSDGVKSADRAMAILEVFREQRRPISARALADALSMPRSSTNVLLRSMIAGGYLRYDEQTMLYYPTLKVFHLGSWLIEGYLDDPALDAALHALQEVTGETVCLWARIGTQLAAIAVIPGPQAISLNVETGTTAPLFSSVVGLAMLGALDDQRIAHLYARYERAGGAPLDQAELEHEVTGARLRGYCIGYDRWLPDAGAVAAAIDPAGAPEPLVIGIGGPTFRVRRNESAIIASVCEAKQHIGQLV